MTQNLTRTNFHSSKLIRCLADLAMVDAADADHAFAEKLGQWIHFADAITLSSVHGDGVASPARVQQKKHGEAHAAASVELERVQALLTNSVMKSFAPNAGRALIELPMPDFALPFNPTASYAPYRRFYEAHQRDMELSITPLRYKLREAVAKASPVLKKLAELDETFEKILRDRESKLLARIPVLLKKRFEQLFKEHQQTLTGTEQADNAASWIRTGGWLARFCQDMHMLLLAELELRLQPAAGLLEAFKNTP